MIVNCVSVDVSLPLVDEKASLPAIIVTPSSPSHEREFCIAFLAAPPKPSFRHRLLSQLPKLPSLPSFRPRLPSQIKLPPSPFTTEFEDGANWALKTRTRSTLIFAILLFIMACHLILHEVVTGRPHLDFGMGVDNDMVALNTMVPPASRFATVATTERDAEPDVAVPSHGGWFKTHAPWTHSPIASGKRRSRFVVSDGTIPDSKPENLSELA